MVRVLSHEIYQRWFYRQSPSLYYLVAVTERICPDVCHLVADTEHIPSLMSPDPGITLGQCYKCHMSPGIILEDIGVCLAHCDG